MKDTLPDSMKDHHEHPTSLHIPYNQTCTPCSNAGLCLCL